MSNKNTHLPYHIDKISSLVSRRNYYKVQHDTFEVPSLLGVQYKSFQSFIEKEIFDLIESYFPIVSNSGKLELHFQKAFLKKPEITEQTAWEESKTYQGSLNVVLNLVNNETGEVKSVSRSKNKGDNSIFFGDIPLITEKGTFIVNGIEKFVISQIVRAPGTYLLTKAQVKLANSRKRFKEGLICELLPIKGILMFFFIPEGIEKRLQIIARNNMGDNAPQFAASIFLKGLGISNGQIQEIFGEDEIMKNTLDKEIFNPESILKNSEIEDILNDIRTSRHVDDLLKDHETRLDHRLYSLLVKYDKMHGKRLEELIQELDDAIYEDKNRAALQKEHDRLLNQARNILEKISIEYAAKYIIQALSISSKNNAKGPITEYQTLLWNYFFNKRLYDIGKVGRYKTNRKLRLSERLYQEMLAEDVYDNDGNIVFHKGQLMLQDELQLFKKLSSENKLKILKNLEIDFIPKSFSKISKKFSYENIKIYKGRDVNNPIISLIGNPTSIDSESLNIIDLFSVCSYISNMNDEIGNFDDIDHLGNKRLRLISELLLGRVQVAMLRIEKFIKDKMNNLETKLGHVSSNNEYTKERLTVKSLINTKPFQIIMREFFNSHQLTQFIDQQNPLSELTNKRRISAMGPGGINREDPNLDIRDVHYSHYGRICPIETPEGMNIGLIMSLAAYAKIDDLGFLVSPYYKVENGRITNEIKWLTALQEDEYVIVEAMTKRDAKGYLESPVDARYRSLIESFDASHVNFIDISPRQVVSIAAASIPFLENDDANRALMGANMQRQATPLLRPYAPIVGTGFEYKIARDFGMVLTAKEDGLVVGVDGDSISIRYDGSVNAKKYPLIKFKKSNQDTLNNQTPLVKVNQKITKNDVLVDGPSMNNGELALGQNVLIAFTTWSGYNYEDAIILSSRLVQQDIYTSIHIDEYSIECIRTKNGDEEIVRQITNVPEEAKQYLDEDGIIMVGAEVKEGDILVGKISPKGQIEQSPEEKLLQAIFSEKVKGMRDSSLRLPHGGEGVVIGVKRFSVNKGHTLNDDVLEVVKVFVAQKRKIQIGDKIAGRHGNKGIVSKIVAIEDMPFLADGTPIDILLNPLGVPSRMNIGQVLEMHVGLAARKIAFQELLKLFFKEAAASEYVQIFGMQIEQAQALINAIKWHLGEWGITTHKQAKEKLRELDLSIILNKAGLLIEDLGYKIATPVFSGINREDLINLMQEAGIDPITTKCKFDLFDGRTGEKFTKPISVGIMYMLKLGHMVDDKIHARAVGPYSKITQQPLGGKSQNGGQRFGEMEVWALEAYGAAYNLRELLTLKSDDIHGRNLLYSSIIKGKKLPQPGLPESFKLLIKKLQGLGFKINISYTNNLDDLKDPDQYTNVKFDDIENNNFYSYESELSEQINELMLRKSNATSIEEELEEIDMQDMSPELNLLPSAEDFDSFDDFDKDDDEE